MTSVVVDGLTFTFPNTWETAKCDDWVFYRRQFQRVRDGIKAVDLLALSPGSREQDQPRILWLIEVKDYRRHFRTKTVSLDEEMAEKVLGTLASLLPAKLGATASDEARLAGKALNAQKIRVVLHLEQPQTVLSFYPRNRLINEANVLQNLRKRVKAIDPHPEVVNMRHTHLPWTVT